MNNLYALTHLNTSQGFEDLRTVAVSNDLNKLISFAKQNYDIWDSDVVELYKSHSVCFNEEKLIINIVETI